MKDCVDEKLATALHEVPVPEGLAERLLERLAAEPTWQSEELIAENERLAIPRSSFLTPRWSRRWLLAGSGLLAIAGAFLIALGIGLTRGDSLSEAFVLDEAIRSFDMRTDQVGHLVAERPAPAGYPFSFAVLQVRGVRWRPFVDAGFLGHKGLVYDLPAPTGTKAILYVVDAGRSEGFSAAPARRPFTTGGCSASAWQENGLLYVLVVQGDPATYRAFLNLPHGPVA
jgi:hypothetical protein